MFRSRKHEVGDNPLSKPILIEQIGNPTPLSDSDMLEFLGKFISEREQYISEQQEQIYSEQKENDGEENEEQDVAAEEEVEEPEVMTTTNAKISQISSANQYISQLNRMERSLKGFAPSIVEQVNNNKRDVVKEEKPKNKRITFDDDVQEEENAVTNENGDKVVKSKTGGKKITFD